MGVEETRCVTQLQGLPSSVMSETREAPVAPGIDLPCRVVAPQAEAEIAELLGLSTQDVQDIARYRRALVGGRALSENELLELDACLSFDEHTGGDGLARAHDALPALLPDRVPIHDGRERLLAPGALSPPFDALDASYLSLLERADVLRQHLRLGSPGIVLRSARADVQDAFVRLLEARRTGSPTPGFRELSTCALRHCAPELTGEPGEPIPDADQEAEPPTGQVVGIAFASPWLVVTCEDLTMVVTLAGELVDSFPTRGLTPVSYSERILLLVRSRPDDRDGPEPFARDTAAQRWLSGPFAALPRRTLVWPMPEGASAVIIDLAARSGYPLEPWAANGGETFTISAGGDLVWGPGRFILEIATGTPVFDTRQRGGACEFDAIQAFALGSGGRLRVLIDGCVSDEHGVPLFELEHPDDDEWMVAFDDAGVWLAVVTPDAIEIRSADVGGLHQALNVAALRAAAVGSR
jgi:hypothetical protein